MVVCRALVDEVDPLIVDPSREVIEAVERGLLGAPVVRVAPVGEQFFEIAELGTVAPLGSSDLLRKAGGGESLLQVVEDFVGNSDLEAGDGVAHGRAPCGCRASLSNTYAPQAVDCSGDFEASGPGEVVGLEGVESGFVEQGFERVEDAIESSRKRKVVPILPTVSAVGDERKLVIPANAGYPTTQEKLELPGR